MGVRYLKTVEADDDTSYYPVEEVRKRYKENIRSQTYIDRCLLLADCAVGFKQASSDTIHYQVTTQADYIHEDNEYNFLVDGDLASQLGPQLVVSKRSGKRITANYLLEAFDPGLPRYRLKYRLNQYIKFLTEGDWEANREDDNSLPTLLFICLRTTDLIYAKRRTRGLLADVWDDERKRIHIKFATMQNLQAYGVLKQAIWEEA
jgi:hypothetical protein